jgi:hypothetical protein
VNEDECLQRFGLHPAGGDLDQVREILAGQAVRIYFAEITSPTSFTLCLAPAGFTRAPRRVDMISPEADDLTGLPLA